MTVSDLLKNCNDRVMYTVRTSWMLDNIIAAGAAVK